MIRFKFGLEANSPPIRWFSLDAGSSLKTHRDLNSPICGSYVIITLLLGHLWRGMLNCSPYKRRTSFKFFCVLWYDFTKNTRSSRLYILHVVVFTCSDDHLNKNRMKHRTQCCHTWSVKILPWRVWHNNVVSVYSDLYFRHLTANF